MALLHLLVACAAICAVLFIVRFLRSRKRNVHRTKLLEKVRGYLPGSSPWKTKTWLVFYNPYSGYGDGEFVYGHVLKPMFDAAGVAAKGLRTESAGFAYSLLADPSFDLSPFCGIATISGDGVLHEILNGLFVRLGKKNDDSFRSFLRNMPLALVPAGSSNGFATSLHLTDSFDGVKNMLENVPRPTDLLRIEISNPRSQEPPKTFWDFHTFSWAIGGEHDELQERKLRWLPTEIRNLLAPLIVIWQAKQHRAIMDFVPIDMSAQERQAGLFRDETQLSPSPTRRGALRIQDTFIMSAVYNSPAGAHDVLMSTTLKPDDGAIELMIIRKANPYQLLQVFLGFEDASYLRHPLVEHYRVSELAIEPEAPEGKMFVSGEKVPYGNVYIKNCHHHAMLVW